MSLSPHMLAATDSVERRLEFARLPEGWAAVGSVVLMFGLLYAVYFLYFREQRVGASLKKRMTLATLRAGVLLTLVVIWLEPVLAMDIHRTVESFTLLLVDGSASMSLRDRYPNPEDAERVDRAMDGGGGGRPASLTREELVGAVLNRGQASVLRALAERNAVQVYRFADKLVPAGQLGADGALVVSGDDAVSTAAQPPAASRPGEGEGLFRIPHASFGNATDIGRAIRQSVEAQAGAPIAGIVVVSDGRFNHGEPAEVVARYARGKRIPIIAVGVGDPSPPRNITVAAVEAPPNVFVKDPFKVTAHLRAAGLDGARIRVELLEQSKEAPEPTLSEAKEITVEAGGRLEPVAFDRRLDQAREVNLIVRVQPVEAETLTDDNQQEVTVRALENKIRVLLVSGGPTWEYQFVSRLLERDATFDVSVWLQSADENAVRDGTTVINHFPRKQEELMEYDCIVLLDPQPGDFDPAWTAHIEELVGSYGGGLLYVAGRIHGPRFAHDANTQALVALLPVVVDANEADLMLNELGHFQTTAWPFVVPPPSMGSPVLAMSDLPAETPQIWNRLPGVYWHYPVRREKPVATVLLRHSNPRMRNSYGGHVLLATQFFGAGRTAFMGFDTTWRWRRYGERYFNRYWVQLLRYLVEGKLLSGQQRGLLQFDRDQYAIGEAVTVEARLLDARHLPLVQDEVQARVSQEGGGGRPIVLKPEPSRPGWYRGEFVPSELGRHTVQIDLPGGTGTEPAAVRGEVRVGRPELEFLRPELDRDALQLLASQSAGGRYLEIDELGQLSGLIPSGTRALTLNGPSVPLWDRWWTLVLLIVLLGVEWLVRKRAHLL